MYSKKKLRRVIRVYGIEEVAVGDKVVRRFNSADVATYVAYRKAVALADNLLESADYDVDTSVAEFHEQGQLLLKFAELQRQLYRLFWERFELVAGRAFAVKYSGNFLVVAEICGCSADDYTQRLPEVE